MNRVLLPRPYDILAAVAFTVIAATASWLVSPIQNVPLIDDWTYAWSVEHLQETHGLAVLDWSVHYPLTQILWAWPFVALRGFTFFTLRLSTLVLGWIASLALFGILRLGGVTTPAALVGTLAFFLNPVFFFLDHSFMTDVPYLACTNLALLGYALWLRQGHLAWLLLGGLCGVAAFFVRQLGALVLLLPLACLVFRPLIARRRAAVVGAVIPLPVTLAAWWLIRSRLGVTSIYAEKSGVARVRLTPSWWLTVHAWDDVMKLAVHTLVSVGLILLPLTVVVLASVRHRAVRYTAIVAMPVAAVLLATGRLPDPLEPSQILSVQELGLSRSLVHGADMLGARWPPTAIILVSGLAFVSGAVAASAAALAGWSPAGRVVMANLLAHVGAGVVLVLIHDRYYLPLMPMLILGLSRLLSSARLAAVAGTLVLCTLGTVGITGTIDGLRFNDALTRERADLLAHGVPPQDIDGGYVLNGWWLYAHDLLDKGNVPFVTSDRALPYTLATAALPCTAVIRRVPVATYWATPNRFLVLHRLPHAATSEQCLPTGRSGEGTSSTEIADFDEPGLVAK